MFKDVLLKLVKQLHPTGRAWNLQNESDFESFYIANNVQLERFVNDSADLLNSILPDNSNFTESDCFDWEVRLGLITNTSLSLEVRKEAIIRKMNYPGNQLARQNYRFLEYSLQKAGFDLYIYENTSLILPNANIINRYGQKRYGQIRYGKRIGNVCIEYLDEILDQGHDVSNSLKESFFVSSIDVNVNATVPISRKLELRELIIKIKPLNTVGFLNIDFV